MTQLSSPLVIPSLKLKLTLSLDLVNVSHWLKKANFF